MSPSPRQPLTVPEYEERQRRLARAYRALAQCSRALVRSTSEPELLLQVCKVLVQVGEYPTAWVGYAVDDAARSVRCAAQAGHSDGYFESIQVSWADDPHGRGPTGTCIRTGKAVVNRDSSTDPSFEPWRAQALERGFASSIALPLRVGQRVVGALTVYSSRRDAFDPDEEELLTRLAEELAFGIGAQRDRAERDEAEGRLHAQELRYRQLVQNFPNGALGFFDKDLRYLLIDGEGLATIGQSSESLTGKANREVFPEGFTDKIDPLFRSALAGVPAHAEVTFAGHWFDLHLRPVRSASGDVEMGFVSSVDVTDRRTAEEAVAASEALFRSAFDDAVTGKVLTALDGRILRVNAAYARMLGWAPEELVGRTVAEITHPDEQGETEAMMRAGLESDFSGRLLQKRYVRRDGTTVWAEVNASMVRGPDGSPRWYISDVQDVTARRIAEEQLRQSQKLEAVGLLAGGIAHDFNNLLTVMLSASRFALDAAPAEGPLREDVEQIHAAGQKALALTQQLLAFGRKQILEPRLIDLNGVVADAEKLLGRVLGERVALRTELAPGLGAVLADPGQIHQVVMNLAVNARDAMPRGGTLTIRTSSAGGEGCSPQVCKVPGGACVRLTVEDTGVGMDAATRARVFEPFFTTKPVGKGTGLGLSTVFGIVKQTGGDVRVWSEPGKGARFDVCFPRAGDAPDPEPSRSVPASLAPPASARVLVVEDDEHVRRAAVRILRKAGLDVVAAANLEEALALGAEHGLPPAVLLTDVRMPAHTGPEVAAALEACVPGLRTVYMSGYSDEDVAADGVIPEGAYFVQKPFSPEGLVGKVLEALAAR